MLDFQPDLILHHHNLLYIQESRDRNPSHLYLHYYITDSSYKKTKLNFATVNTERLAIQTILKNTNEQAIRKYLIEYREGNVNPNEFERLVIEVLYMQEFNKWHHFNSFISCNSDIVPVTLQEALKTLPKVSNLICENDVNWSELANDTIVRPTKSNYPAVDGVIKVSKYPKIIFAIQAKSGANATEKMMPNFDTINSWLISMNVDISSDQYEHVHIFYVVHHEYRETWKNALSKWAQKQAKAGTNCNSSLLKKFSCSVVWHEYLWATKESTKTNK
jgi:hypothetical protein